MRSIFFPSKRIWNEFNYQHQRQTATTTSTLSCRVTAARPLGRHDNDWRGHRVNRRQGGSLLRERAGAEVDGLGEGRDSADWLCCGGCGGRQLLTASERSLTVSAQAARVARPLRSVGGVDSLAKKEAGEASFCLKAANQKPTGPRGAANAAAADAGEWRSSFASPI